MPAVILIRTTGAGKVILAIGAEDSEFGFGVGFYSDRGHLCFRAKMFTQLDLVVNCYGFVKEKFFKARIFIKPLIQHPFNKFSSYIFSIDC